MKWPKNLLSIAVVLGPFVPMTYMYLLQSIENQIAERDGETTE